MNVATLTTPEARQFAMDNPKLLTEKQSKSTVENVQEQVTKIQDKVDEVQNNRGEV